MEPVFVLSHIRRSNRNLLILGIVFLLLGLPGMIASFPAFYTRITDQPWPWEFTFLPEIFFSPHYTSGDSAFYTFGVTTLFFLIGSISLVIALRRRGHPERHPLVKDLAKLGVWEEVARDIEKELQQSNHLFQHRKFLMTRSWLFQPRFLGLKVVRLDQIAWMYEQVTQHYTNGIPSGKTYRTFLWLRDGVCLQLECGKGDAQTLMTEIWERVPWVLVGHSDENRNLWHNNRNALLQGLDERRRQALAAGQ